MDERFIVCAVSRLSPEKGLATFIRAVSEAYRSDPAIHGLIVGDGPSRPELERLTRSLEIEAGITFFGHTNEVGCLLRASDLFVQSSAREGMPFAVLEAMACGLPVILSDLPAHRDAIGEVPTPLVAVGNHRSLAARILELRRIPGRGRSLGSALRERWGEAFTVDRMIDDHERLYLAQARFRHHRRGREPV